MKEQEIVFKVIDKTREYLGDDWQEHWLKVLKPETIANYLLWEAKQDEELEHQMTNKGAM